MVFLGFSLVSLRISESDVLTRCSYDSSLTVGPLKGLQKVIGAVQKSLSESFTWISWFLGVGKVISGPWVASTAVVIIPAHITFEGNCTIMCAHTHIIYIYIYTHTCVYIYAIIFLICLPFGRSETPSPTPLGEFNFLAKFSLQNLQEQVQAPEGNKSTKFRPNPSLGRRVVAKKRPGCDLCLSIAYYTKMDFTWVSYQIRFFEQETGKI